MTTIITRVYADAATARGVVSALLAKGLDQDMIDVIGKEGLDSVEARLQAASVNHGAAAAIGAVLTGGHTAVVVRAPFNPVGTARNAIKLMDRTPSIKVEAATDEYIRVSPDMARSSSVMADHPFFMSNPHRTLSHGHVFGAKLLSAHKEKRSVYPGGKLISSMFWPMKHLSAHKERNSAIKGTWLFSKWLGDMPTVIGSR